MKSEEIKIISLNIEHGYMLDELRSYIESKKQEVSIFCFQEIDPDALLAFAEILQGDFSYRYVEKQTSTSGVFYRNAIFVRNSFTISDVSYPLEGVADSGLAITCTATDENGHDITITNVHGVPRPGHKLDTAGRIEQSDAIIKSVDYVSNLNVVVGDFNLLPEADSIKVFKNSGYSNLIDDFKIPTTRNELSWRKHPESKQLFADYAFIKNTAGIEYDFVVEDITVSDHLPLVLTVMKRS